MQTSLLHSKPCQNKAIKDGFCGIHHPDAKRYRQAVRDEKLRIELAYLLRKQRMRDAGEELVGICETLDPDKDIAKITIVKMRSLAKTAKGLES
jgi:hypothetical protein